MTKREWVALNHPECISDGFAGGVLGCPREYGLRDDCNVDENGKLTTCEECWDKEVDG